MSKEEAKIIVIIVSAFVLGSMVWLIKNRVDLKEKEYITVEIVGRVRKPGYYQLPKGAKLIDLLELAEIKNPNDLKGCNLASMLSDKSKHMVPAK